MDINDKLDKIAADFSEHRGEMRQFTKNMSDYVGAVSSNVRDLDKKFDEHKEDDGAHGIRVTRVVLGGVMAVLTLAIGAVEVWMHKGH